MISAVQFHGGAARNIVGHRMPDGQHFFLRRVPQRVEAHETNRAVPLADLTCRAAELLIVVVSSLGYASVAAAP